MEQNKRQTKQEKTLFTAWWSSGCTWFVVGRCAIMVLALGMAPCGSRWERSRLAGFLTEFEYEVFLFTHYVAEVRPGTIVDASKEKNTVHCHAWPPLWYLSF